MLDFMICSDKTTSMHYAAETTELDTPQLWFVILFYYYYFFSSLLTYTASSILIEYSQQLHPKNPQLFVHLVPTVNCHIVASATRF